MKIQIGIFILALVAISKSTTVKYKDCGSKMATVKKIEVFPCDVPTACHLKKGQSYTINATFETSSEITAAEANVHGIIAGIPVPFPLKVKDACKGGLSGLNCPIPTGTISTYTATLPIQKLYPDIKVIVKWELQQDSTDIICFELEIAIVP
uniref:NPC intracellular cholesterol transporter 2 n=1 Tax=Phallusia mammillata TaxID=59560 RepID=A0A6F9DMR4_9ASCI|nr:epididymal secretory protein E1-like [Phallusia mammillata]